jgi:hypothetical protein
VVVLALFAILSENIKNAIFSDILQKLKALLFVNIYQSQFESPFSFEN